MPSFSLVFKISLSFRAISVLFAFEIDPSFRCILVFEISSSILELPLDLEATGVSSVKLVSCFAKDVAGESRQVCSTPFVAAVGGAIFSGGVSSRSLVSIRNLWNCVVKPFFGATGKPALSSSSDGIPSRISTGVFSCSLHGV